MRLSDLVHGLDIHLCGEAGLSATLPGDVALTRICDITEDSRTVLPGSLFIARSGLKTDGKQFAKAAVDAGAAAILTDDASMRTHIHAVPVLLAKDILLASSLLAERFYGDAAKDLHLIGVTGTNGKTTTTFLCWQLLNRVGTRCGLIGTVIIDDGVEVAAANMTTPPAIEISRSIARMRECACQAAALEVSSHALDQKRADALRFKAAVFSNLTGDHLDYHGTMENYASAKARLFSLLREDGVAIVNALDPWSQRMVRDCKARVIRAGVIEPGVKPTTPLDATCQVTSHDMSGMGLTLTGPWGTFTAKTSLVGLYNAFNILAAVCSTHALGVSRDTIASGIAHLTAPPGRLERVTAVDAPFSVFVDYAHSDDSLRNVLRAVGSVMPNRIKPGALVGNAAGATHPPQPGAKLWCVFGCGGDRDRTKRPRMGLAASELADMVVVTSDNPRTERPSDIVDQILAGVPANKRDALLVQVDRERAIDAAIANAREGDVIIIAGKGHETEQILPDGKGGTIRTHFDDREVAREALTRRGVAVLT
ncbi:MAG TPA: UDP-N-acetylmuramoyl-L-alanyl-D-glutamate--2,6-diaminopimelate ligase [Phycisphaerales bacterium]|nr:UDP-N-acetylmuramoyl-L-alanyl-D-glutamate--2,6-diaminopimelate ligase [Phycisphaerales bacterium]